MRRVGDWARQSATTPARGGACGAAVAPGHAVEYREANGKGRVRETMRNRGDGWTRSATAGRAAAACAASSSRSSSGSRRPSGSRPDSAIVRMASASPGLTGSTGPWRYEPITRPCTAPSVPSRPLLPRPRRDGRQRDRRRAPASCGRAWFSKPIRSKRRSAERSVRAHVADDPVRARHGLDVEQAEPLDGHAGHVDVAMPQELVAAADADDHARRAPPRRPARNGGPGGRRR